MDVRLFQQIVGPSGKIYPCGPGPSEVSFDWYKEWRLEVTIENQRYKCNYRGSWCDPRTHDPEFEDYLKKDLAHRVGKLITEQIMDAL